MRGKFLEPQKEIEIMKHLIFGASLLCATIAVAQTQHVAAAAQPAAPSAKETTVTVVIETSEGSMTAELYADKAPLTVSNFLAYVDSKFYDGTIFHRVIPNFMIQGGGFTADLNQKTTRDPVKNEAGNGLGNLRGTLAMARTMVVDSATAQFFINHKDNAFLDHQSETSRGFGYAVFGKVIKGIDVLDKIAAVQTGAGGPFQSDLPLKTVTITSIRRQAAAPQAK